MLILERTLDTELTIGSDIRVRVHKVRGRRVWLAIDAPRTVPILRAEAKRRSPATQDDTIFNIANPEGAGYHYELINHNGNAEQRTETTPVANARNGNHNNEQLNARPPDERDRVVVVENNPADRELITRTIARAHRMPPLVAESSEDAISLLDNLDPDDAGRLRFALVDLVLGPAPGTELIRWARNHERFRKLPMVILSGHSCDERAADCLQAGASAFVAKPDNPRAMRDIVRHIDAYWSHAWSAA